MTSCTPVAIEMGTETAQPNRGREECSVSGFLDVRVVEWGVIQAIIRENTVSLTLGFAYPEGVM